MGENETIPAAQAKGWKSYVDWDSPAGLALTELLKDLSSARDLRHTVIAVVEKVKKFEFQLESSIFEVQRILRDEARVRAQEASASKNSNGLLPQREVAKRLGVTRAELLVLSCDAHFPKRVQISPRRFAYRVPELEAWIEATNRKTINRAK